MGAGFLLCDDDNNTTYNYFLIQRIDTNFSSYEYSQFTFYLFLEPCITITSTVDKTEKYLIKSDNPQQSTMT